MLDANSQSEAGLASLAASGDGGKRRVFAVANQKGGVGKTTTAINLGTALASVGRRVCIVDLDPQGNASTGLGISKDRRQKSIYDVLHQDVALLAAAIESDVVDNLFVVPSSEALYGADIELRDLPDGRERLKSAMDQAFAAMEKNGSSFDYILIDCPPSLNLLTINALVAADSVLVPLQCEFFALEGMTQFINTVKRVRKTINPRLGIEGIILTMFENRHNLSKEVATDARRQLGYLVYETIVPRNVRIAEAPSHGVPAMIHDQSSIGSQAYIKLAVEMLERANDPVH
ncbi:MAG: AAA family ATPase [Pseudomonadota bacterium]